MTPIERLDAVEEIRKLKARYFRFVDTKDWDGLLGVYAPDARIDFTYAQTPTDHAGRTADGVTPETRILDPEGMVASARRALDGSVSVHHGHMPEIEVTSETTATGVWPMEDMIRWPAETPPRSLHGFGHYQETYVRLADGWKIHSLKLTRLRVDTVP